MSEAPRYLLICCSLSAGFPDALAKALRCADEARNKKIVPIARCLDHDFAAHDPQSVAEMRQFEIDMMRRKFPDLVEIIGADEPDMAEVVAIARQWQYLPAAV